MALWLRGFWGLPSLPAAVFERRLAGVLPEGPREVGLVVEAAVGRDPAHRDGGRPQPSPRCQEPQPQDIVLNGHAEEKVKG